MNNFLNSVKLTRPQKNMFDLSHDVKLSANAGKLIPICVMECVPSDKVNIGCQALIRLAPLVSPVMHRIDVTVHYFFVPNRLVWPNFEKWITNTPLEGTGLLPAHPTLNVSQAWRGDNGELPDYMGLPFPPEIDSPAEIISALPFAAFQFTVNEYYRDQNLQDPIDYLLEDGDNTTNIALKSTRYRAWQHDYFTSCLPFAQKGDPVDIPIGDFNDVPVKVNRVDAGNTTFQSAPDNSVAANDSTFTPGTGILANGLWAETSALNLESATINNLRIAFRLQEWLEKQARGGTRYIESILTHFAVRSSDKRLNRPEYITGVKTPIIISEVLNTTGTEERPQGDMAGRGVGVVNSRNGSYYCEEHGYIIGIMSIMPQSAYMQGIDKHYLKTQDPTQLLWPTFVSLGEQEVNVREIYAYTALGSDVFGYIPRYAEYRFMNNRVAGDFRDSLSTWHWARRFTSEPLLNEEFVSCTPSYDIFAVTDPNTDHFYCQIFNQIKAVRPLPKYGVPSF